MAYDGSRSLGEQTGDSVGRGFKLSPAKRTDMTPLEAVSPEPLPVAETAGVVLILSLAVTVGWLMYLYR
ncbi:MAG: hypothetical protein A07HR60_02257 [uncultured archaeon A07HR60]|nr:MAG: hypothetical protein A07HR60_02257 [uncultured archaeon A07HR60]